FTACCRRRANRARPTRLPVTSSANSMQQEKSCLSGRWHNDQKWAAGSCRLIPDFRAPHWHAFCSFFILYRSCGWSHWNKTRPRVGPPKGEEALALSPTKTDRNLLLDRLPKEEKQRLMRLGEAVLLPNGYEVYRQGRPISHVYFPTTGSICLTVFME